MSEELGHITNQMETWAEEVVGPDVPTDFWAERGECELNPWPVSASIEMGLQVEDPETVMLALATWIETEYGAEPKSLIVETQDRRLLLHDGTLYTIKVTEMGYARGNVVIGASTACYGS